MKLIKTMCAIGAVTAAMSAGNALAKVSPEEAAKLGTDLTPIGAEKAGNADSSIPAWTGGITTPPASHKTGQPYPDPYADDKALFTINAANMSQYGDKLSDGQKAMLKTYSTFNMPVFPSRRSVGVADEFVEVVKKNALNAILDEGGNGLLNFESVIPFPMPQSGIEVIWNHITRPRGGFFERTYVQVTPTESGAFSPIKFNEEFSERFKLQDFNPDKDPNVQFYFKQAVVSPARLAGNISLVHETINQIKEPRRAWVYNAGQRRVRKAPQLGYDGPGTASDGLRTTDNFDGYNGAPDRYDWKLVGKKEMYVPYNAYRLDNKSLKYDDLVKPGHIDPTHARYELHRVWVVEATLKKGARHIYSKRVFYIDEDSWSAVAIDHYDGRGELWRVADIHSKYLWDAGIFAPSVESLYDLQSGRYIANGLSNEEPIKYTFKTQYKSKDFTPAALRRAGRR